MPYCRECGTEVTRSQFYCKKCGTETEAGIQKKNPDPKVAEDALSVIEAAKVMFRFYTYPANRKWLTLHVVLSVVTAGAWAIWLLWVWFSIWDGTTSKDIDKFIR